jgi:FkbM family methyltransferase
MGSQADIVTVTTRNRRSLHFKVRSGTSDSEIVQEVVTGPYYVQACDMLGDRPTVIDIGGHIGSFSLLAAARGARVIALEPVPENFRLLQDNVRLNGFEDQVIALNAAVWSSDGERGMRVTDENTGGSSLCYGRDTDRQIMVRCVRLEALMEAEGVVTCDLLKLDCEGAEFNILPSLSESCWSRIKAVLLEYHLLSGAGRSLEQLQSLFSTHGFLIASSPGTVPSLGYVLAVRPPFTITTALMEPLDVALSEPLSPLARMPLVRTLWRSVRLASHRLVVFYMNQMIAAYNQRQQQQDICLQLLSQQAQQHSSPSGSDVSRMEWRRR